MVEPHSRLPLQITQLLDETEAADVVNTVDADWLDTVDVFVCKHVCMSSSMEEDMEGHKLMFN